MKKAGVILLCVFYFLVACGFNINMHYCAGKLKGISLMKSGEKGCCGSKKKSKGCCKEKSVLLKVKGDHQLASKVLLPSCSAKNLLDNLLITNIRIQSPIVNVFAVPDCNAPPFHNPDPVYLLNRNFRI